MGLLSEGTALNYDETKHLSNHIKSHGIEQFINQYSNLKNRKGDCLKWGDEIEYILVKFDHKNKTAKVSLRGTQLLEILRETEEKNPAGVRSLWRPEYAEYMVEGTPGQPYGSLVQHLNIVEHNMRFRRQEVQKLLDKDEVALSITNFFRLGCPGFTHPESRPRPSESCSRSLFFPDEAIAQSHPRFKTLTANIRHRRGKKVVMNVPIFKDKFTPAPFREDVSHLVPEGGNDPLHTCAMTEDSVYLDAMGFGMGCCCLQMTFQTKTVWEARILYDQLTPLCPIMLALSAACPIFRGYLTEIDCRWDVISALVDCRTDEESGLSPLDDDAFLIPKSRYSSVDMYISEPGEKYNDTDVPYDSSIYDRLVSSDVDPLLAKHISHLFIRDPISVFAEKVYQDDQRDLDHFENIQSTNWQTMRFKVPPISGNIGWRVEFRPCEVQITDFENAAYGVFITLLTRAILAYKLNLLIPISKVDENMGRSQKRNAVVGEKFWFRSDIFSKETPAPESEGQWKQMTLDQIFNGDGDEFVGLIPLIRQYLTTLDCDADTACTVHQYLKLLSLRANGTAMTNASWIRKFVSDHPLYQHDSVVSETVAYDLLVAISEVTAGNRDCPELFGINPKTRTSQDIPKSVLKTINFNCANGATTGTVPETN